MKCPNCGSTSQPKLIHIYQLEAKNNETNIYTYKCGCGTKFQETWKLLDRKILK